MDNNIHGICDQHADERLKTYQDNNKNRIYKPGDFVKTKLMTRKPDKFEHMWIKVTRVRGNLITGILDNNPVFGEDILKCGDEISIGAHTISNCISK